MGAERGGFGHGGLRGLREEKEGGRKVRDATSGRCGPRLCPTSNGGGESDGARGAVGGFGQRDVEVEELLQYVQVSTSVVA